IRKRQFSIKEKIQQWKRQREQRENILSAATSNRPLSELSDLIPNDDLKRLEMKLVGVLEDKSLNFPLDLATISSDFADRQLVKEILIKLSSVHRVIELAEESFSPKGEKMLLITSVNYEHLKVLKSKYTKPDSEIAEQLKRPFDEIEDVDSKSTDAKCDRTDDHHTRLDTNESNGDSVE